MDKKMHRILRAAIKEALDIDQLALTAGGAGELRAYGKKIETFLNETFDNADKLADEGEDLIRENYLNSPVAAERKRIVMSLVGYLRETRNSLGNVLRLRYLIG